MQTTRSKTDACFPDGFLWGCATSSYQIEGGVHEGDRGLSIWDEFSHISGNTWNDHTGDVAADFFNRYSSDIQLMRDLGLKAFRFSIAWPRVFPNGTGRASSDGMDFYSRIVDALLAAGIKPFCTLYHWDLPKALQDEGGWENRDTAAAFADYAGYIAGKLSDRVDHFVTMNEMRSFVEWGHRVGLHAPGLRIGRRRLAQLNHNVLLAHGLGVKAVRAYARSGTAVGIAEQPIAITPVYEAPEHIAAARLAMREENASYLTAVLEGQYTESYIDQLGGDSPIFTQEEMETIRAPLDFLGVNVYQPTYVRADDSKAGYSIVQAHRLFPRMLSQWLHIGPEALFWVTRLVTEVWNIEQIYITENGASCLDEVSSDGRVYDIDRIMFIRNYLTQMLRAVNCGVPIKGYFLWTLTDNFEWADGYEKRFGITHVDFSTQVRTPKLSAEFYKHVIAQNRVV